MSRVEIVDENYRLQVNDLFGEVREVAISNVSYQGLEELTPVLHFHGGHKRMVLSAIQVRDLIILTGTPLPEQWIGYRLFLTPLTIGDEQQIAIRAATKRPLLSRLWRQSRHVDYSGWMLAFLVVTFLSTLSALYVIRNYEALRAVIVQLGGL
jgi:hypothetical protein